jgi:Na+/melibiose symporter-like transporter
MTMVWISASFCYYLISYQLKFISGSVYWNTIVSSSSEIVAYLISGVLMKLLGLKKVMIMSYSISLLGMLSLVLVPTENQFWIMLFILGSKFGIS